ncbi:hypothetical protein HanIR_Chr17g0858451 [Helianthus annuus]|nr:hypothetical protein HanIR_Chr17g0858451 [Helianthus annuus]
MSGLCQRWSRLETTGQIHVARLLKRPFRVGSERFIRVGNDAQQTINSVICYCNNNHV